MSEPCIYLEEGDEGCQTNLVITLQEESLLFCNLINLTLVWKCVLYLCIIVANVWPLSGSGRHQVEVHGEDRERLLGERGGNNGAEETRTNAGEQIQ